MKFRKFREISSKPVENTDIYTEMTERANKINSLLESIKIEDNEFEKGVSDIDQKWIRENESKEYTFSAPVQAKIDDNIKQQYLNAVKRLALDKIKNDLLFEGKLGTTMKNLSSMGLNVTRESILRDIEAEINRQQVSFGIERPSISSAYDSQSQTQTQIANLKNNLGNIFESIPTQEQKPIYNSGSIPREPAVQSPQSYDNSPQISQSSIEQTQVDNEKKISEQLRQAQEDMKQQLEWAKQQPNEPTFTSTRGENISLSPEWTKDDGISGYTEPTIEQVRNGLESTNKEQTFDDVYEFELKKLTELKKSNNPNYEVELNNAIAKISSLTDRIPNIREQIESDISYEMRNTNQNQQQEVVSTPTLNQEESEKVLQEQQKQMKDKIIDQIMGAMNRSGEFSFGDISMNERMSIMQNVQNKLNAKNMDELQMLLSTYQEQNVQEENISSGMHR